MSEVLNKADRDKEFSELFEKLVCAMTNFNVGIDIPLIEQLLVDISVMFRLSKGITHVYRNPQEEKAGGGEVLCAFDTGKEGKVVAHERVVTSVMTIVEMFVYMTDDVEPLTQDELEKVKLVMRTTVSFISRNRLRDIVEELAFYDDQGFRNIRSLTNYIFRHMGKGKFDGVTALNYNLRHFILVNQEVGRRAGDIVLKRHYEKLRAIIGDDGDLFRLGGDNFIAFCANSKFETVLKYLEETAVPFNDSGDTVSISSSVGAFVVPQGFVVKDLGDILEKIIAACQAAQMGGNEHTVFYDDSMLLVKEKSMRVQQLFPGAMRNEEFKVFYQPKVDIETGELCGAEALCRWIKNGSIIPPCDFIPMLEETSDICKLDLYMLDRVCKDICRWLDEGRNVVRVSVNFSRKHMMNPELLNTITGIIDKNGISHKYIEIELTETTSDVEFNYLKRVVTGLQKAGVYTSVDDFGIGYSSLNLIRAIPWNVLKVDRSFLPVAEDDLNSSRSVMFRHVIAMARELGLECIAEGVETQQQLNVMRENNCIIAQGFLFDKPLPVEEFEQRLEKHSYVVPE